MMARLLPGRQEGSGEEGGPRWGARGEKQKIFTWDYKRFLVTEICE